MIKFEALGFENLGEIGQPSKETMGMIEEAVGAQQLKVSILAASKIQFVVVLQVGCGI